MLTERIQKLARRDTVVGMGIGVNMPDIERCIQAAVKAEERGYGHIVLVGVAPDSRGVERIPTPEPEKTLVELLSSNKVEAVVRGTISASRMLKHMKERFNLKKTYRIALLETAKGHSFFFAPVGVDEGESLDEKFEFIAAAQKLLARLSVQPKVAVLSGGRLEDMGRSPHVDKTLTNGELLTSRARQVLKSEVKHYGILIEEAVRQGANFILAPDGISGNLIYRTLIHLGSGVSHGALYTGVEKIVVDTSRAAPMEEYLNATALASAFVSLSREDR